MCLFCEQRRQTCTTWGKGGTGSENTKKNVSGVLRARSPLICLLELFFLYWYYFFSIHPGAVLCRRAAWRFHYTFSSPLLIYREDGVPVSKPEQLLARLDVAAEVMGLKKVVDKLGDGCVWSEAPATRKSLALVAMRYVSYSETVFQLLPLSQAVSQGGDILHFSGHGASNGSLFLEQPNTLCSERLIKSKISEAITAVSTRVSRFSALLVMLACQSYSPGAGIQCVFLSACHSSRVAPCFVEAGGVSCRLSSCCLR